MEIVSSQMPENVNLTAVQRLKECDGVYSLYRESISKDAPKFVREHIAGLLRKDPSDRRKAVEEIARAGEEFVAETIQRIKAGKDNTNLFSQSTDLLKVFEDLREEFVDRKDSSESEEEEQDPFELLSLASLLGGRNFIPDCVST